jgi:hypothetical protein
METSVYENERECVQGDMNMSGKAELAEYINRSIRQALRVVNGENLGSGAEKWITDLRKEADVIKDGD